MFTRSDLSDLSRVDTPLSVSLLLPTHVRGAEIRQGSTRLKNLTAKARDKLISTGMAVGDAETLLAPAAALVDDYTFWQHQDHGLALFLNGDGLRSFRVPMPLAEQVVVGPGFCLKPLLPLLAADGVFRVLTLTADRVSLFTGSRFALDQDHSAELPGSLGDVAAESDYENPVQASPVARPNTGSINIGNAQVYGDSPAEWRKGQLIGFARTVAAAIDAVTARQPLPVVLVADAELGGHFQKASGLGSLLSGVVETNPESLDDYQLHAAAYALMQPRLDGSRRDAVELFTALQGQGDSRAVTDDGDVVRAAHRGQVDSLLLRLNPTLRGRHDPSTDEVSANVPANLPSQDLYEKAALLTLEYGGAVHILAASDLPGLIYGAAILRF